MRLRIARKMDRGWWKRRAIDDRDKRPWYAVYTDEQLDRAERRLRKSWHTHRVVTVNEDGQRSSTITLDWYAANRVRTRRIRQGVLRRSRR